MLGLLLLRLVAVAADEPMRPDVPHLASIATHPDVRGTGLGAAVTAALTRQLLAGTPGGARPMDAFMP